MEKNNKLLMATTHEKQNTRLKISWEWSNTPCNTNMEVLIFTRPSSGGAVPHLCCDHGGPNGGDVQTGLTDRMVQ
jgi:hypothetical protein